jgi:predicted ester cyclase
MATLQNTLLYRWFDEVWNNARESAIDEMMIAEVHAKGISENNDPTKNELEGINGFRSFYHEFRKEFPDIRVTVEEVVAEDDNEVARCTVEGKHASSGKDVRFSGLCMVRKQDGKIVQAWNNFDFLTMYQQIGKVPV